MCYRISMEERSKNSGKEHSATVSPASQTSRPDTYVVLNLLPPSRIEWLKQQSLQVAEVFHGSTSPNLS
jgi:hypothetical protein